MGTASPKATTQRAPGASAKCEGCIHVIRRGSHAAPGKARYSVTFVPYLIGSVWKCRYRPQQTCVRDSSPHPYDFHSSVDKFVEKNPVQQGKRLRLNDSYLSALICSILPVQLCVALPPGEPWRHLKRKKMSRSCLAVPP